VTKECVRARVFELARGLSGTGATTVLPPNFRVSRKRSRRADWRSLAPAQIIATDAGHQKYADRKSETCVRFGCWETKGADQPSHEDLLVPIVLRRLPNAAKRPGEGHEERSNLSSISARGSKVPICFAFRRFCSISAQCRSTRVNTALKITELCLPTFLFVEPRGNSYRAARMSVVLQVHREVRGRYFRERIAANTRPKRQAMEVKGICPFVLAQTVVPQPAIATTE